jgi:hypothetical protein
MLGELADGESVKTATRRETNHVVSLVARKLGYSVGSGPCQDQPLFVKRVLEAKNK